MPHLLRSAQLTVAIDLPAEGYQGTRFDWTGKVVSLAYQGVPLTGGEWAEPVARAQGGRGLYNEFGLDAPVGYAGLPPGGWFPKLGIGALQRDAGPYRFHQPYPLRPADFAVVAQADRLALTCTAPPVHGYAYRLEKTFAVDGDCLSIVYALHNLGTQPIHTHEYTHNFLAFGDAPIGPAYRLAFPFALQPAQLGEALNPAGLVSLGAREVTFGGSPQEVFFFSQLAGLAAVPAQWTLTHAGLRTGLEARCDAPACRVNLWGAGHVISPELFVAVAVAPGQAQRWTRRYRAFAW